MRSLRISLCCNVARLRYALPCVWLLLCSTYAPGQVPVPAPAQEATASVAAEQQPSPRVARLSFLAGELKVQRADNTGEDSAVPNMTLREGTRILAGEDGRAEIEFEDGSLVRLTPGSSLSLDSLAVTGDAARTHITLLGGLAYFELRAAKEFSFLVEANSLELSPVENTSVRVHLSGDAPPAVAVFSGTARVDSPGRFHVDLRDGESLRIDGSDPARYFLDQTYPQESWDWWNEERDQAASDQAAHTTEARDSYAAQQGYGWADMDANGTWYDVPGLGLVWQPYAADESFDPYGFGDWVFDSGGYTFVSGYSWGWTPFRCGRWSYTTGFGWGWSGGAECGRWGFGGPHRFILGTVPAHYTRPEPPPLGGHVHRVVAVRGPDGARPPVLIGRGPAVFHGHPLQPLPTAGSHYTPQGGSAAGRALLRDYPLNRERKPILGLEPGTLRVSNPAPGWHEEIHPAPGTDLPATRTGRESMTAQRPDGSGETVRQRQPGAASPVVPVPVQGPATHGRPQPSSEGGSSAAHSEPVHAPAASHPVQQHRVEAPAAPIRSAPAPPPPARVAPSPTPAATQPVKPK